MKRGLISAGAFLALLVIVAISRHAINSSTTTTTTTVPISNIPAACAAKDFTGTWANGEGAAGTIYASVTFQYNGTTTCSIDGTPQIVLYDENGEALPTNVVPATSTSANFSAPAANEPARTLTIKPGDTTNMAFWYSDVPSGTETSCPSATSMKVGLPAGPVSIIVTPPYALQPCDGGQLTVSPFY